MHTTLDVTAQKAAERSVRAHAGRIEDGIGWWASSDVARVQGAMVALDPRNGEIRALVGGRSYERRGFNRALAARRQPGSAFKPFVYAAALRVGYTPATIVDDDPVSVDLGEDVWKPANYADEYRGPVTLRQALAQSANAATVRVSRAVGERRVVDLARRNGIASELRAVPAVALGALEVTPIELVTAYAPFANGGFRVQPRLIRRIERSDGSLLWSPSAVHEPVMDPRDAFQVDLDAPLSRGRRHWPQRPGDGHHRSDRRQDRNDQWRQRHLVHRLHAKPGGGLLVRVRRTALAGRWRKWRALRRPRVADFYRGGWNARQCGKLRTALSAWRSIRKPGSLPGSGV